MATAKKTTTSPAEEVKKDETTATEAVDTPEKVEEQVDDLSIYERLQRVQTRLRAPKGKKNDYGKYMYRSCEDILEAVKPLLSEYKLALVINDDIELIGDRFYIKAVARLVTPDGTHVENSAYAREAVARKGMDDSQVTGSASSYARKYALNGLFCIDDTKDADASEAGKKDPSGISPDRKAEIIANINACKSRDEMMALWRSLSSEERTARDILDACKTAAESFS